MFANELVLLMSFSTVSSSSSSSSSAYLYLHSLVQRPVHESVERQEESANGVEESVSVLAVPVESENQGQALNQSHPKKYETLILV